MYPFLNGRTIPVLLQMEQGIVLMSFSFISLLFPDPPMTLCCLIRVRLVYRFERPAQEGIIIRSSDETKRSYGRPERSCERGQMYDTFELKRIGKDRRITGYRWTVEHPQRVVLVIHGIGEYCGRYDDVAAQFMRAGCACLGMDLRGHGLSAGPAGHCAPRREVLRDMDELIEYAQIRYPGLPLYLYGHSLGGNLVLDYRCRGTYNGALAGYIVTSPWILLRKRFSPLVVAGMKGLAKLAPTRKIAYAAGKQDRKARRPERKTDPMMHDWISLQTVVEGYIIGQAMACGRQEETGRAAGIPLLLMHGTDDRLCDIEGSRRVAAWQAEDCTYIEWEGYSHELHLGTAEKSGDAVIRRMIQFMTE